MMVKLISRYWGKKLQKLLCSSRRFKLLKSVIYRWFCEVLLHPPAPPPDVPRAPPPPAPPLPPRSASPPRPVVQKNCVLLADRVSITVATPLVRHCKRPREVCTHRNMIKGSKRLLDKAQNPPSGLESQQRCQLWFAWVQAICIIREALKTEFWKYLGFCPNKGWVVLPIQRVYHFFSSKFNLPWKCPWMWWKLKERKILCF